MIDPGDGRDGSPVGAYSGVWVLVSEGAAGVFSHPSGWLICVRQDACHLCPCRVSWSLGHPTGWFDGLDVVDVCAFRAYEILDKGKWMMLVHIRRVSEWIVLLEIPDNVGMR